MNKLTVPIAFACLGIGIVLAAPPQPSSDLSEINAVKQVEQEMGDAMMRLDVEKLSQIYADDFAMLSSKGKVLTKQDILHDFDGKDNKLESYENGPMDVQVFGNVAMVHGGTRETRSKDGKDVNMEVAWMDLLEKRDGRWVVVHSAGKRIK
jgi:ketosteroid isomerase-like protein